MQRDVLLVFAFSLLYQLSKILKCYCMGTFLLGKGAELDKMPRADKRSTYETSEPARDGTVGGYSKHK